MADGYIADPAAVPTAWAGALAPVLGSRAHRQLLRFVAAERRRHTVYPPEPDTYAALELTPLPAVRVVILGQDPYHGPGQAHGLSFSADPGTKIPPSLRNIYKELHNDVGLAPASHGCLRHWARQGVLLLNTVLTVRAGQPGSHAGRGWEALTDAVLDAVNAGPAPVVFLLWGRCARAAARSIDADRHTVIESAHPSPLSASRGFFGSRPFSRTNAALQEARRQPIDWKLPVAPSHWRSTAC